MSIKVGINGFGRIGRNVLRAAHQLNPEVEIVAVNDIGEAGTFAHLLKHDTTFGTFKPTVQAQDGKILVDGRGIKFLSAADAGELRWRDLGVDIVVESTDHYTDAEKARVHIERGGAEKVIISAPGRNQDVTLVMGITSSPTILSAIESSPWAVAPPTVWYPWSRCCTTSLGSSTA